MTDQAVVSPVEDAPESVTVMACHKFAAQKQAEDWHRELIQQQQMTSSLFQGMIQMTDQAAPSEVEDKTQLDKGRQKTGAGSWHSNDK